MWIIVGSVIAFAVSQLVEVLCSRAAGEDAGGSWARAVGSTSSRSSSTIPRQRDRVRAAGDETAAEVVELSITKYASKFLIAVATMRSCISGTARRSTTRRDAHRGVRHGQIAAAAR